MDQPDLYSTQEGPSSGSPQFLEMRGYGSPHTPPPPETDQDSCPGWLPPVPLDLDFPQDGFSPGSLTPRLECFPCHQNLSHYFLEVFSVWYTAQSNAKPFTDQHSLLTCQSFILSTCAFLLACIAGASNYLITGCERGTHKGAPSPFLPSRILEICSFALQKLVPEQVTFLSFLFFLIFP